MQAQTVIGAAGLAGGVRSAAKGSDVRRSPCGHRSLPMEDWADVPVDSTGTGGSATTTFP